MNWLMYGDHGGKNEDEQEDETDHIANIDGSMAATNEGTESLMTGEDTVYYDIPLNSPPSYLILFTSTSNLQAG